MTLHKGKRNSLYAPHHFLNVGTYTFARYLTGQQPNFEHTHWMRCQWLIEQGE